MMMKMIQIGLLSGRNARVRTHRIGAAMRIAPRFRTAGMVLALATLLAGSALATGQVGDVAAGFTLQSTTGQTHSLSDYDGKVKFLFMFGHG
jgi:hypothetical protein